MSTKVNLRDPKIRDAVIARAVNHRKIAPDRAADYKRLYDADPRGIFDLLTAPVEEGGLMAGVAAADNPLPPPPQEYPREWIAGSRPSGRVAFEDAQSATEGVSSAVPGGTVETEHPSGEQPEPGAMFRPQGFQGGPVRGRVVIEP